MNSLKTSPQLLNSLQKRLPEATFEPGPAFAWSPQKNTVVYKPGALRQKAGQWSLLHEAAHAILDHQTYASDFDLLLLEVAAWEEAKSLAAMLKVASIDEEHIQDCLDTYRDWLHKRSTCPTCGSVGLQHSSSEYHCHNCHGIWAVTPARFCRAYRRKQQTQKETSPRSITDPTTFR